MSIKQNVIYLNILYFLRQVKKLFEKLTIICLKKVYVYTYTYMFDRKFTYYWLLLIKSYIPIAYKKIYMFLYELVNIYY